MGKLISSYIALMEQASPVKPRRLGDLLYHLILFIWRKTPRRRR